MTCPIPFVAPQYRLSHPQAALPHRCALCGAAIVRYGLDGNNEFTGHTEVGWRESYCRHCLSAVIDAQRNDVVEQFRAFVRDLKQPRVQRDFCQQVVVRATHLTSRDS